jgi:hypothetical protein
MFNCALSSTSPAISPTVGAKGHILYVVAGELAIEHENGALAHLLKAAWAGTSQTVKCLPIARVPSSSIPSGNRRAV